MGGEATAKARQLRRNQTEAELALWKYLRPQRLDGHKFRWQAPIGPYIVDFACFPGRLVVELDGGQHSRQAAYDSERTTWLEAQGFRVLRFWNNQVPGEIEAVKEVILGGLARGNVTPHCATGDIGNI